MDNPILALLAPSLLLVPAMGILSRIEGSNPVRQEVRRKALHVAGGLAALALPQVLTQGWQVMAALSLILSWMLAVRMVPDLKRRFGCVLHDAGRVSCGELYFAAAVASLLLVTRESAAVLYVAPVLILALADAAAAIVGRRWPRGQLPDRMGGKTVSGSTAFFLTALVVTTAALSLLADLGPASILAAGLLVSLCSTVAEAVSPRGTDNLTVPATAWLALSLALPGA